MPRDQLNEQICMTDAVVEAVADFAASLTDLRGSCSFAIQGQSWPFEG
jgi:hypothetical protein